MNDCLFCKIINKEIPAIKVYEDEKTFAFLDINPVSSGHTLVIPKKHSRNIFDIEKEDLNAVMNTVQKLSIAMKKAVGVEGLNISNNNEKSAGQVIFHTHFHIVPRKTNDGLELWKGKPYSKGEAERVADKIKKEL